MNSIYWRVLGLCLTAWAHHRPAFTMLATNLSSQGTNTTYTDKSFSGSGPFFYRVGIQQ